jgi:hypothetical protein
MKTDNFYDITEVKSGIRGVSMEKNFPAVVRPARRIVKDQESTCAEYEKETSHSGSVSFKKNVAFK